MLIVQASPSAPTRFFTGTRTSSMCTSFTACMPPSVRIGLTVTPGCSMSISRNEMPACFGPPTEVRTRQKIRFAYWAQLVHSFVPVTT